MWCWCRARAFLGQVRPPGAGGVHGPLGRATRVSMCLTGARPAARLPGLDDATRERLVGFKRRGEAVVRNSGLGYTIVRPGPLVEEAGGYKALVFDQGNRIRQSISCADVADVCLKALHDPLARNKTFEVRARGGTGGRGGGVCTGRVGRPLVVGGRGKGARATDRAASPVRRRRRCARSTSQRRAWRRTSWWPTCPTSPTTTSRPRWPRCRRTRDRGGPACLLCACASACTPPIPLLLLLMLPLPPPLLHTMPLPPPSSTTTATATAPINEVITPRGMVEGLGEGDARSHRDGHACAAALATGPISTPRAPAALFLPHVQHPAPWPPLRPHPSTGLRAACTSRPCPACRRSRAAPWRAPRCSTRPQAAAAASTPPCARWRRRQC